MAIAYDAAAEGTSANLATSLTYAITTSASATILHVGVVDYGSYVTGVTHNGTAMTQTHSLLNAGATLRIFSLASPDSGTNNIVISKSSGNNRIWSVAASYTGASTTGIPDATGSNSGSGTSLTTSVTSVADNCWMFLAYWNDNGGTVTASTGSTKRIQVTTYGGLGAFDNNADISPAGSNSMAVTAANGNQTGVAITFAPAATASTFKPIVTSFM